MSPTTMAEIDNESVKDVQVGMIGGGSMGGGMTLLFAEHGGTVGVYDYSVDAVKKVLAQAKADEAVDEAKVHGFSSLDKLLGSFAAGGSRILVLSLPHGKAVDSVLDDLDGKLQRGDIVIDAGNEWWADTERRQARVKQWGVDWVGMGVSGGYQAARHGPSMSPGCTDETYEKIKGHLEKWCARTPDGDPCVRRMGPGGAGHYVKMLHNGIEHAHLSILAEIHGLLEHQLGLTNFEIADLLESWTTSKTHPLRGNYLIDIGYKALRFTKGDGIEDKRGIVERIEDKVTQDVDLSEGTGTWSTREMADRHVAAPAIAASHQLRVISGNKFERLGVTKNFVVPQPAKPSPLEGKAKDDFLEDVRQAVYGGILGAFVQGLELITRASTDQKWGVKLTDCLLIWRAGCIIQSDGITAFLYPLLERFGPNEPLNLLKDVPELAKELAMTYAATKRVYAYAVDQDAVAPALGATLEWFKAIGGRQLPTDFEEMELDYFGHHNYDIKGQAEPGHEKGKHHTEFAPA
ncbi:hypothetical protein Q5752_003555 [Cryptotrichosporon argae]